MYFVKFGKGAVHEQIVSFLDAPQSRGLPLVNVNVKCKFI